MSIAEKKIINAIVFFASKSAKGEINRLKLMKLLWISDRIHLNKYGRLILKDTYNALPHGPVPSKTLNYSKSGVENFFHVSNFTISSKCCFDTKYFSKSDIEVMEFVWAEYGALNQFRLRDFSHLFPEWLRYEEELEDGQLPNSYPIIIDDFFLPPATNTNYVHTQAESDKAKIQYHTHNSILSYLSE